MRYDAVVRFVCPTCGREPTHEELTGGAPERLQLVVLSLRCPQCGQRHETWGMIRVEELKPKP